MDVKKCTLINILRENTLKSRKTKRAEDEQFFPTEQIPRVRASEKDQLLATHKRLCAAPGHTLNGSH